jgi:hypothetical protein
MVLSVAEGEGRLVVWTIAQLVQHLVVRVLRSRVGG